MEGRFIEVILVLMVMLVLPHCPIAALMSQEAATALGLS